MPVPWAIVPAAGRGRRLLPTTAVVPKVLLPVGDRPMLQWALEEALEAGVGGLVVVVSPEQPLVRAYLEAALASGGGTALGRLGRRLRAVELHVVEQPEPAGVGDALIRCRRLTGPDAFAVLLPDNWFDAAEPPTAQVAVTFARTGLNTIGLIRVRPAEAALFGNVGGVRLRSLGGRAHRILALQDKGEGSFVVRGRGAVPRGCGRYVLGPDFYDALERTGPPRAGEWDDVPAFQRLAAAGALAGHLLRGRHFDVGHVPGYLAAAAYLAGRRAACRRRPRPPG